MKPSMFKLCTSIQRSADFVVENDGPFRSHVQQLEGLVSQRLDSRFVLVLALGRVETGGLDALAHERVDLVLC